MNLTTKTPTTQHKSNKKKKSCIPCKQRVSEKKKLTTPFFFFFFLFCLQSIRKMLGESETDLRSRRAHRHAVPADTAFTNLMVVVVVVTGECIRGFARDIPRQRRNEDKSDQSGGQNEDESTAKTATPHKTIGLNTRNQCHVDRRKVAQHCIRNSHRKKRVKEEKGSEWRMMMMKNE